MKKIYLFFTKLFWIGCTLWAQSIEISQEQLHKSFDEFYQLLSIPNDAHFPEQVSANVAFMEDAFEKRDFKVQKLETDTSPSFWPQGPIQEINTLP